MFAVLGITGQVGGAVARTLLQANEPVRAVVRDEAKARTWQERGCQLAVADMDDPTSLTNALSGACGVFVMLPSNFDPEEGFPDTLRIVEFLHHALSAVRPEKVVCLSTIGAHVAQPNLLSKFLQVEQRLGSLPSAITFLRAAWFVENATHDVVTAAKEGRITSYLQPLDRRVPMVSIEDVGRVAAEILMNETWSGARAVELEGPQRVSPNEIAATLSQLLGCTVDIEAIPRDAWETLFRAQGANNPLLRMRMLDGFNEGWIEFESVFDQIRKGGVTLTEALSALVRKTSVQAEFRNR